jgi:hypothetical protein
LNIAAEPLRKHGLALTEKAGLGATDTSGKQSWPHGGLGPKALATFMRQLFM